MAARKWIPDPKRFLTPAQQAALRTYNRQRLKRAGEGRVPWLEWFLVELALETGLRVGEMAAMVCGDLLIDLSRAWVFVRNGKGGKSRYVRVRGPFRKTAARFLKWKRAAGESVEDDAPVFCSSRTGDHMTRRALQKAFLRVCDAAGVQGFSIHSCRHTYATELLAACGNLRIVQKQLGHARIETTQIYADVFDQAMDAAVEGLYGKGKRVGNRI